jgi:hypothetical protein
MCRGKPEYSDKNLPQSHYSTIQLENSTWTAQGMNPGRRGEKPATNNLSMARPQAVRNVYTILV